MLRSLAFVAVRQETYEAAEALPLGLGRGDELIEDDLRAVGEVAELGFPHDEHARVAHGVAVLEADAGVLGERRVVNAELGLFLAKIVECGVRLAGLLIKEHGMSRRERAALNILTGDAHSMTFE